MSHLSEIIKRVKGRLFFANGDPETAAKDTLWLQSVSNLHEYMLTWDNYTEEEQKEAEKLFDEYHEFLVGTPYELKN